MTKYIKKVYNVQIVNKKEENNQEYLDILRKIAKDLGLNLGKFNYCLNELKKKELEKINNSNQK